MQKKKHSGSCVQDRNDLLKNMHLFKRDNGIYYVYFSHNNARSLKTKDPVKAERIFKEIEKEYLRGRIIKLENSITINDLRDSYLESLRSKRTYENSKIALNLLISVIGNNHQIHKVSKSHLDKLVMKMETEGYEKNQQVKKYKVNTINGHIAKIISAFNWAVERELLKENKLSKYKKLKERTEELINKPAKFLEPFELEELRRVATEELDRNKRPTDLWRWLIDCYIYTGLRRSEPLAIDWKHINLRKESMTVFDLKNGVEREIPIHPALLKVFNEMVKICPQRVGKLFNVSGNWVSKKIKILLNKAGIHRFDDAYISTHLFRHTFISILAMEGFSVDEIADITGHKDTEVIREIYRHVKPDYLKDKFSKVDFTKKIQLKS